MIIQKNMVLQGGEPSRRMRVVDEVNFNDAAVSVPTQVVWIDIDDDKAQLEIIGKQKLIALIGDREYKLIVLPSLELNIENLTKGDRMAMDRRWEIWLRCKEHVPNIYLPEYRGKVAAQFANDKIASKPFFYDVLRRVFQNGPSYTSMATNFHRCGAPGESRISESSIVKLGRPRLIQPGKGLIMTEQHLRNMRIAWVRSPVGRDGRNLKSAWSWMLITCYSQYVALGVDDEVNAENYDNVPSFEQFQYHWKKEHDFELRMLLRHKSKKFDLMFKPLLTGTLTDVKGPGHRYYIDATVIDNYCVSQTNPNQIIGRPTLYIVIDQFSRLIVGMYVGLEPPCWVGAMLALWNCSQDKVKFCAKYGVEIDHHHWPVGGVPLHLMGDRGELMSHDAERLLRGFGLDVENSTPYSGEAKGVVERAFRTLQAKFGPYVPGYVDKEFLGRGNKPPALSAVFNLHQMTGFLIKSVIWSNCRVIRDYNAGPELINSEVPAVPIDLWHWGVDNLNAGFRVFDENHLRRNLWPQTRLKLSKNGAKLMRGLYYFGAALPSQAWYLKAQHSGDEVTAYYHPTDMTSTLVIPPDARSGLHEVTLTPHSQKFSHLGFSELVALDLKKAITNAEAKWENLDVQTDMESKMHSDIKAAKREASRLKDSSLSKAQRLANIKANKKRELESMDAVVNAQLHGVPTSGRLPATNTPEYEAQSDDLLMNLIQGKLDGGGYKN